MIRQCLNVIAQTGRSGSVFGLLYLCKSTVYVNNKCMHGGYIRASTCTDMTLWAMKLGGPKTRLNIVRGDWKPITHIRVYFQRMQCARTGREISESSKTCVLMTPNSLIARGWV